MNEPLATARSLATLSLPLHEMREVGRHFHATLNDVVVTVVDEGVHRYLRGTGRAFPHRLVAMCPMSLREEGDTEAATKASAMFVHLGAPDATVAERVVEVVAAMGKAKEELRAMSKEAAMLYAIAVLGLAELGRTTGVGRVAPPPANLVISNVPGAKQTMYLNGARLLGTYAVPAIAASVGLNVTVSSYADSMDFGFGANGATMYRLPDLARHVADAYAELKAAARGGARSGRHSRNPRRTKQPRATAAARSRKGG
jgi:WS/DGAT/MGAT family acyltransferase